MSVGLVKQELARIKLPDREAHNSRLFVDLCENIHIHHREFRAVFSLDEYFEFVDVISRSTEDVRSYLAQNPNYEEGRYETTVMVAGGKERQRKLIQNSPRPNASAYFANDFAIELQDESVVDEIHVHWRDYRFAMPREHFKAIAAAFAGAERQLEKFEAENEYRRKPHRDRTMEDFEKERAKYESYETRIMGETTIPIAEVRSRHDGDAEAFNPKPEAIGILVGRYASGARVCPILLSTERNGEHYVIDGNHRLFAAKQAGLAEINCVVTGITFGESELFRKAEGLLKKFDRETDYRFNASGFNQQFMAQRMSRHYGNHFHGLLNPSPEKRLRSFVRRARRRGKEALRRTPLGKFLWRDRSVVRAQDQTT